MMAKKKFIRGSIVAWLLIAIIIFVIVPTIFVQMYVEKAKLIHSRIKELTVSPSFLKAGSFMEFPDNYRLFIYEIDGNNLKKIRVFDHNYSPRRVIMAETGEYKYDWIENKLKLVLFDGTTDEPKPGDPNAFYKVHFRKYHLTLRLE